MTDRELNLIRTRGVRERLLAAEWLAKYIADQTGNERAAKLREQIREVIKSSDDLVEEFQSRRKKRSV